MRTRNTVYEDAYGVIEPQITADGIHVYPFDPAFPLDAFPNRYFRLRRGDLFVVGSTQLHRMSEYPSGIIKPHIIPASTGIPAQVFELMKRARGVAGHLRPWPPLGADVSVLRGLSRGRGHTRPEGARVRQSAAVVQARDRAVVHYALESLAYRQIRGAAGHHGQGARSRGAGGWLLRSAGGCAPMILLTEGWRGCS